MSIITLVSIKAEADRLNSLIAKYEAQPFKFDCPLEVSIPKLDAGERWVGLERAATARAIHARWKRHASDHGICGRFYGAATSQNRRAARGAEVLRTKEPFHA